MRNKALRTVLILSFICILGIPMGAMAERRSRATAGQRVVVVPTYSHWGWRDPFWGGYGGYYAPSYYPIDTRGKIKLKDFNDYSEVYLNGAYAGTVDDMKSIRLDPGRYTIEIRDNGREIVDREVYVVTGKTIEIRNR